MSGRDAIAATPLAERLGAAPSRRVESWLGGAATTTHRPMFAPVGVAPPPADSPDPEEDPRVRVRLADAYAAAQARGFADGQAESAELRHRLVASVAALAVARAAAVERLSVHVIDLAVLIAGELVAAAPVPRREALHELVRGAVAMLAGEGDLAIRIHPDELSMVQAAPPLHPGGGLRLVDDASLAPGDCVVESARRIVDATFTARLAEIRAGMIELLESGEDTP